jgi:acyl-CoA synthetase (AMP-forming)/AMP-acid ligase II
MARKFANYGVTVIASVPTVVESIAKAETPIPTLRLVITGAMKLSAEGRASIIRAWPQLRKGTAEGDVIEGYGLTETGPLVIAHRPGHWREGTIGELVDGVEAMLVDSATLNQIVGLRKQGKDYSALADTLQDVENGQPGVFLVRDKDDENEVGKVVMDGYVGYKDEDQPFVWIRGKRWFITGDSMKRDAQAPTYFIYLGRDGTDFVKRGGEMVGLLTMEEALYADPRFARPGDDLAPLIAIVPEPNKLSDPRLVLFTTRPISPLSVKDVTVPAVNDKAYVDKVIVVKEIPMQGKPAKGFLMNVVVGQPDFWEREYTAEDVDRLWQKYKADTEKK